MRDEVTVDDLLVIGGGVNGVGIARDAAGRGLSTCLVEMGDLAQATSSASTKLFHGGLRYLEFFEFRLVRKSLIERETLLNLMPHISWPMRFVLPYSADMRFETDTPTSKLLTRFMPWMGGRRPAWLLRMGLFMYDSLGGRKILPPTKTVDLQSTPEGAPLRPKFKKAFEYSDCWVDDSRLVALTARDARSRGANILTRTKLVHASQTDGVWQVTLRCEQTGEQFTRKARVLVNAAGPWVETILRQRIGLNSQDGVRLVRGSHIVTKRLFDHGKCYFFQGTDGRIMFAIPYETDFTLIGTTDQDHDDPETPPVCTDAERDYMLEFVNNYLAKPVSAEDIVWSYSGVRPLYDDSSESATSATRDYRLKLDKSAGAPLLSVFGGKITTFRNLAEHALEEIGKVIKVSADNWTDKAPLPGGDFPVEEVDTRMKALAARYPFLGSDQGSKQLADPAADQVSDWTRRLFRAYGSEAQEMLGEARSVEDLGENFGATLTQVEVDWLMDREFAITAEDVLWRRSKLGLRLSDEQAGALETYMASRQETTTKRTDL